MREAYIVAGFRSAVAKAKKGGFRFYRPDDLAADVIKHLLKTVPDLDPKRVDDLIVGNAFPEAEQGLQVGRMIALQCLPQEVPGVTVNRFCASGIDTISMAVARIRSGMMDCVIAGGTESMSMVPMTGWKLAANYNTAKDYPGYYMSMGLTAEKVAREYKIAREDQDEFSYQSHMKALNALKEGYFKDQIVPIEVEEVYLDDGKKKTRKNIVDTDEGPRGDTTVEALAKLKPVFAADGTVTAGSSSQTSVPCRGTGETIRGLNTEKVNVNGGAIALGHPLGCTGAKLSVQIFNELRRRNQKYGMVTACVGGGQGVAGIYELLN